MSIVRRDTAGMTTLSPTNFNAPLTQWTVPTAHGRFAIRDFILTLDPDKDNQLISYLSVCYDFPWDTTRALEFALFRSFGMPHGAQLLASTGEFTERTQKRYDDTVLLLSEMLENGPDSERGRAALRRMNQQHGHYVIPNDEFLFTLSTFIFEPIRWNARFGWRHMTEHEKLATYFYWRHVGKLMNIKDIPPTIEAFEQFNIAYERERFQYTPDNERVAVATRNLMLSWVLPKPLWPLGAPFVNAVMDDYMLDAVGLPHPPRLVRWTIERVLRLRGMLVRLLPRRGRPRLITRRRNRTYPDGYRIEQLGADGR